MRETHEDCKWEGLIGYRFVQGGVEFDHLIENFGAAVTGKDKADYGCTGGRGGLEFIRRISKICRVSGWRMPCMQHLLLLQG